jgi:hypothetical protein
MAVFTTHFLGSRSSCSEDNGGLLTSYNFRRLDDRCAFEPRIFDVRILVKSMGLATSSAGSVFGFFPQPFLSIPGGLVIIVRFFRMTLVILVAQHSVLCKLVCLRSACFSASPVCIVFFEYLLCGMFCVWCSQFSVTCPL